MYVVDKTMRAIKKELQDAVLEVMEERWHGIVVH